MAKVKARPGSERATPKVDRVDETLMKPGKYEVTPDHKFEVKLHLLQRDKRWVVSGAPTKKSTEHIIVFRLWSYDELVDMKKKATSYDAQRRMHMIDNDALNRMKIQALMVSWTLERDNARLKLHHVNGVLTDESWDAVSKLQTNILMYVITEMNNVLEFNG